MKIYIAGKVTGVDKGELNVKWIELLYLDILPSF